mgnify:CR=1 FL=1
MEPCKQQKTPLQIWIKSSQNEARIEGLYQKMEIPVYAKHALERDLDVYIINLSSDLDFFEETEALYAKP